MKNKGNKGFTLIELLVVIAIIAILSTVVMAGLNSARLKGRDAKRLSDVKQLQAALELYFDSCGGYPTIAAGAYSTLPALVAGGTTATCVAGAITPFMATMPTNPSPGGIPYTYCGTLSGAAAAAASCLAAGNNGGGYVINFSIEGAAGSLATGPHTAQPSGII